MSMYFFVISFGIMLHVILDVVVNEGCYMLLWPITTHCFGIVPNGGTYNSTIEVALDAIILLLWLYHEEVKHKIKDYI